jgi:hypothetical protein
MANNLPPPNYNDLPPHPSREDAVNQVTFNNLVDTWINALEAFFKKSTGDFKKIIDWIRNQSNFIEDKSDFVYEKANEVEANKNTSVNAKNDAVSAWEKIQSYVIPNGTAIEYNENIELIEANMSNMLDNAIQIELLKKGVN